MAKVTRFLVIHVPSGDSRTYKRLPRLHFGEIAYRLNINIPDKWSTLLGDIDISLPEPPDQDAVQVEEIGG